MQESAKAKEVAKRAREAEVFILNPQGAPTTHTVPKPFMLHESTHQVGHQQAVESTPACCTVGCKLSVLCIVGTQAADLGLQGKCDIV